jgi:hypothetical protein
MHYGIRIKDFTFILAMSREARFLKSKFSSHVSIVYLITNFSFCI